MAAVDRIDPQPWIKGGILLAVVAVTGCAFLRWPEERPLAFSHRIHVIEERLDCAMCHEDLAFDDEPGMPLLDTCLLCHDELDEDKDPQRRIDTLFEGEEFAARRISALPEEVLFSHLRHVDAGLECSNCHTGIDGNDRVSVSLAVPMARCVDCHEESSQPGACATCHTVIDQDWAPESHLHNWTRRHGGLARFGGIEPADSCGLCHREDTCAKCHAVEKPRNHSAGFRLKGHGLLARMDRNSCSVCHEPQSCNRCHQESIPTSHKGMWGGTKSMHCLGCHTPLEANGCITCHKSTPSHALAPPKPDWHNPAMNCTQCHGRGLPLSHVDNGENCNICHF